MTRHQFQHVGRAVGDCKGRDTGAQDHAAQLAQHVVRLRQAIRAVAGGQAIFGPGIAARVIHFFQGLAAA